MKKIQRRSLNSEKITQELYNYQGPAQLEPGVLLSARYSIQEVIGVGGMGSVYRARDMHFPNVVKLVAVKEMINQTVDAQVREAILQNFAREADILVTLNHPAIPRIYDYFTIDERSYLVEEYIQGRDLEAIITDTETFIPEDLVVSWAIELCDVLEYLHSHKPEPIIFRDMKPSNVMINQFNRVVLIDFGIAKVFKSGQKGTMIGTEGYSPPEQYRGEATPLADIYALGATLHHALTRQDPRLEPPFTFQDRPISKANPDVSGELESIITTALQYNPKDRFKAATEMKEELVKIARRYGTYNRNPIPGSSAPLNGKPGTAMIDPLGIGAKPLWTFDCEDEIRGTPTIENGVLYIGSYDNNLYALNAANGNFVWKYATDGGIVGKPAVHEGSVYIGSEDNRLHAVSIRSGKVVWTYFTDGPVRSSPRIAEGHIFIGSDDNYLHAVNLISSRRVWRVDSGSPVRSTPFVTNEFVYFGNEGGQLICADFRGEVKWRFKSKRMITSSPWVSQGTVYFASLDSTFYALDARTGWVIWRLRFDKGSVSSPVQQDNLLFIGSADFNIYCIDAGNAKETWRYKTGHQVSASPLIYKDSLYCGSVDGNLYCLEYRTGRLRWKYKTQGPITGSPIVYNDILYFGSTDHRVYALVI